VTAAGPLPPDTAALAEDIAGWLPHQRWFAGKARRIAHVRVADYAALGDRLVLVVVEVAYADTGKDRYQVPLAVASRGQGGGKDAAIATAGDLVFTDALEDAEASRRLALLASSSRRIATAGGGVLSGEPLGDAVVPAAVRRLGVEQSNSSVVFGDTLILKLIRRLEPGENPEVELARALTEAGSTAAPPLHGVLGLTTGDGAITTLAVLSGFVASGREGWDLLAGEAARVARGEAPQEDLEPRMAALGGALAEVHASLANALGARSAEAEDLRHWHAGMRAQLDEVLDATRRRDPATGAPVLEAANDIARALSAALTVTGPGSVQRVHGDLHLGQVIEDADGRWQLLDFEGEPGRSLAARRAPASPLRDVAGLLRSFDYVLGHTELHGAPSPALADWRNGLRAAFLGGYLPPARAAGVLPAQERSTRILLDTFELDKAVYELGYELANRPKWVGIPVGGILRVLQRTRSWRVQDLPEGIVLPSDLPEGSFSSTRAEPPVSVKPPAPAAPPAPVAPVTTLPTVGSGTGEGADDVGRVDWHAAPEEVALLLEGGHADPHRVLGVHPYGDGAAVRTLRPAAESVEVVVVDGGSATSAEQTAPGFFEALLDVQPPASGYRLRVRYPAGEQFELVDPYAFWPTLDDLDIHLAGEGRHEQLWQRMGAHVTSADGISGTSFAVWAPNARGVRVVADFNSWDGRLHPLRRLGSSGIWELFVPDVGAGAYYKFEIVTADDALVTRADPYAFATDVPPATASRVYRSEYEWRDADWMDGRGGEPVRSPLSIYEVHLGSWRHKDGRSLTYRELADALVGHVTYLGFTHVEFLPVAEHPFGGSWGYQVTGYFAPTARFGEPDDFRYLVDRLHQAGIGVIVDWVPAHFPRDEWALARFDGTALYEHADPRQGEHPDWGTLVFNYGRNEVRNFLIANALYWLEELHVDGLRVDAVASMLYLDYSREEGQWVPNRYGGRENLEAIEFLADLNRVVYGRNPRGMVIAEESTAWPGVTRPVHLGGLGFGFKWNMGWMHDTLDYLAHDPIYRRYHHNQLTFSLMYAFSENFVLPLSHDEVVHGKRSLLDKMPGDRWQRFANLRALYGYLWAHPGKQLLFMGGEFGQWREWSESHELDWYLLDEPDHAGLQALVAELNARYREHGALWQRDSDPAGFSWIDANDADDNVLSFLRRGGDGTPALVCVANFSPAVRRMRVGLPQVGEYREVLNTDAASYGGSNVGNLGAVVAEGVPWHGEPASAELTLPPLATIWLVRAEVAAA